MVSVASIEALAAELAAKTEALRERDAAIRDYLDRNMGWIDPRTQKLRAALSAHATESEPDVLDQGDTEGAGER